MNFKLLRLVISFIAVLVSMSLIAACAPDEEAEEVTARFVAISSGESHTCGLREDGSAACWGDNDYGQASPPAP